MVAAWISAETGVGPSIASSNQDCNGNCALFPQAASSNARPIQVTVDDDPDATAASTPSNVTVPNVTNINMIASDRPTSPTRFTINAFLPAVAALGFCW